MTFQPGQSGNPAGRAAGSRNKKTLAAEAALFDHAQELVVDLVKRAKNGEPAAMRLAMERILPVGRGRPLPIDLPPIRSTEDAQAAAGAIMDALKEGAISAREAVDLLRVVEGLTRLTAVIPFIQKVARREVAKAAQTLDLEHFLAGPPAANDYARRVREMNEPEREGDADDLPDRHPDECRSTQDPLYRYGDEPARVIARTPEGGTKQSSAARDALDCFGPAGLAMTKENSPDAAAHPGDGLQIVADSDAAGQRAEAG